MIGYVRLTFADFNQGGQFMTFRLHIDTPNPSLQGPYSNRNSFAPRRSKIIPFRLDIFSKIEIKQSCQRCASLKVYHFPNFSRHNSSDSRTLHGIYELPEDLTLIVLQDCNTLVLLCMYTLDTFPQFSKAYYFLLVQGSK